MHVDTATAAINDIWMDSKHNSNSKVEQALKSNSSIIKIFIRDTFQSGEIESREGLSNPFNIILPAYETLWRVVLRCFLEVRYRSTESELHLYRDLFKRFHTHPTKSVLEDGTIWSKTAPRFSKFVATCHSVSGSLNVQLKIVLHHA